MNHKNIQYALTYVKKILRRTVSRDVSLSDLNITKNSSLKTSSDDVRVLKTNKLYFEASTIHGNINIEDNNRISEKEVKIQTSSGNIYVGK